MMNFSHTMGGGATIHKYSTCDQKMTSRRLSPLYTTSKRKSMNETEIKLASRKIRMKSMNSVTQQLTEVITG